MFIRQSIEPRVLELHGGKVTITVRPCDSVLRSAARYKAKDVMTRLDETGEILSEFGYNPEDLDLLADHYVMLGFSQLLYAVELAEILILDWTGYVDGEGQDLPLARDTIIAVMRQDAERFITAEAAEADRLATEGNVSSGLPSGTGKADQNTAKGAKTKTPPAPKGAKV